jgi:hypothetical protein
MKTKDPRGRGGLVSDVVEKGFGGDFCKAELLMEDYVESSKANNLWLGR